MTSFTIDGGGGTSTSASGRFALRGTSGQFDAGLLRDATGGNYFALSGGFWSPEPCAQRLRIDRSGADVAVNWNGPLGTCVLEYATGLNINPALTVWTPVTSLAPAARGATLSIASGARFFRLRGL